MSVADIVNLLNRRKRNVVTSNCFSCFNMFKFVSYF